MAGKTHRRFVAPIAGSVLSRSTRIVQPPDPKPARAKMLLDDIPEERDAGPSPAERPRGGEAPQSPPALPPATITPYRDGPYLVRGAFRLLDQDGNEISLARRTVALCRCGMSRTRPFCDGTHQAIGFRAPGADERGATAAAGSHSERAGSP